MQVPSHWPPDKYSDSVTTPIVSSVAAVLRSSCGLDLTTTIVQAMAEAVAIAGAAIGITSATAEGIKAVTKTVAIIDHISEAPQVLHNLKSDLDSIKSFLMKLQTIEGNKEVDDVLSKEIILAINNCIRLCEALDARLKHWTKGSREDKMTLIDKVKFTMFGEERVKSAQQQLDTSKSTLNLALTSAALYVFMLIDFATTMVLMMLTSPLC